MANLRILTHRMLYCHRSLLNLRSDCFRQFHGMESPSVRFQKSPHFPSTRRPFHAINPPLMRSPLLMVPPKLISNGKKENYFHFYSVSENKVLKMRRNDNLMLPWQREVLPQNEAICVGSSHGWLAFIHPRNCSLYLFNPLLMGSDFPYLPLPPIQTLPSFLSSVSRRANPKDPSSIVTEYKLSGQWETVSSQEFIRKFVKKIVLSSAPLPLLSNNTRNQDITVLAIQGYDSCYKLAFCRLGHTAWTSLNAHYNNYIEILYFSVDQSFYAVTRFGALEAWDLRDPVSPNCTLIMSSMPPRVQPTMNESQQRVRIECWMNCKRYLVESNSGDLLMVVRYCQHEYDDSDPKKGNEFDVYKVDFVHKKWVYVPNLGDQLLFVGENQCVCLSASNFPGLIKNSIYFTYFPFSFEKHDMGVFSLEDGSVTPFFQCEARNIEPPPIWVIPPQSCPDL